jgi:hypothetical protein
MTTMDNRVGEGQGGVAATYGIVLYYVSARVNIDENVTVGCTMTYSKYHEPTFHQPRLNLHSLNSINKKHGRCSSSRRDRSHAKQ